MAEQPAGRAGRAADWLATLHLLADLWLGIAAFTVVTTGLLPLATHSPRCPNASGRPWH